MIAYRQENLFREMTSPAFYPHPVDRIQTRETHIGLLNRELEGIGKGGSTSGTLETVLLAQVPSWILIAFPFQVPTLLAFLAMGRVPVGEAVRAMGAIAVLGLLILVPMQFMWRK